MVPVFRSALYLFESVITFVSCRKDNQDPNPVLQEYWAVRGGGNYDEEILGSAIDRNGNTYVETAAIANNQEGKPATSPNGYVYSVFVSDIYPG